MLLEAGLKKDDDNGRPLRRSFNSASSSSTGIRYDRWVKYVSIGFLSMWIVFVLFYWSTIPSVPLNAIEQQRKQQTASTADGITSFEVAFPQETNILVIGDYGTGTQDQIQVAETMKKFAATLQPKPAFVLSAGDQIYDHGILSADDPALAKRFENMYAHPDLKVPWYITLGNHDCEGSIDAVLEYANKRKDSLWYMPRRYYTIDRPVSPKTILRLIVVDACDLVCGQEPRNMRCNENMNKQTSAVTRTEQLVWLEQTLAAAQPAGVDHMWKVVMGHWGVFSYAGNMDTPELIEHLDPMLQQYRVHAYISGHDHGMQHILKRRTPLSSWPRHYFVNGAGGYRVHELQPKARANADLVHAAMVNGFMYMHVTESVFRVQFIDKKGEVLYTTEVDYA